MKRCNTCYEIKPDEDFYVMSKKNKDGKNRLYWICKVCCKLKADKNYSKDWELKRKYGITLEQFNHEVLLRSNRCDICSRVVKTLHVDHNHNSGEVRGFLCGSCNRGLGLFQDSYELLDNASTYLRGDSNGLNDTCNS